MKMLKLRKKYTLKTLGKYGFHIGWEGSLSKPFINGNQQCSDNVRIGNHDNGAGISCDSHLWIDSHSFYCNGGLDTLYDLIKDGLVVKEER